LRERPNGLRDPGVSQKTILENTILGFIDNISLASDNRGNGIGKVLEELDDKTQGAGDDHPAAKLQAQLVRHLERLEARSNNKTLVDTEMHHPQAIRIVVKLIMKITEDPRESPLDRFHADMRIGIKEDLARSSRNTLAGTDPFLGPNVPEAEVEPHRAFKCPTRVLVSSQFSASGGAFGRRVKPQISPLVSGSSTIFAFCEQASVKRGATRC
jgi:hypothetical protein